MCSSWTHAKVARVVIGAGDPDPRVDGGGVAALKDAGIRVVEGVCREQAEYVTEGFLKRIRKGCPLVTVKLATSLDGRIATASGSSQWITSETSRSLGHGMRARHDAIMVGAATAVLDNPSLTCRLPGLEATSPARIVICGGEPIPETHDLVITADRIPTTFVTKSKADLTNYRSYKNAGVSIVEAGADDDGHVDISNALRVLGASGVTRLMVEGGGKLISSLLRDDLVDRIVWFRAPLIIGDDGLPGAGAFGVQELDAAANFVKVSSRSSGSDTIEIYTLKH